MDFVKRASGLCHPGHFLDGVHEVLKELFHKMANCTTHCMARDRTAAMRKWSMRIAELKASKCSGIEGSPPHAKEILKNKNMKLFAEMVEASGSPDKTIAEDIAKGFDLMGPMPAGGSSWRRRCMQLSSHSKFVIWLHWLGRQRGAQSRSPEIMKCARRYMMPRPMSVPKGG